MRLVNFYFLAVAVMQCIDEIASLAPFSAIAPLGFVLIVSLIREAFDDIVNFFFFIIFIFRKDIKMIKILINN